MPERDTSQSLGGNSVLGRGEVDSERQSLGRTTGVSVTVNVVDVIADPAGLSPQRKRLQG